MRARPIFPNTDCTSGNFLSSRSIDCSTEDASVIDIPGGAVGIYRIVPSLRAGMNSLPSRKKTGTVAAIMMRAMAIVIKRCRTTQRTTGVYPAMSQRLSGFASSRRIRPRMKSTARAGVSVIARSDANPIEYVLVNASGLKSRPSLPVRVNTGRKETVITKSEKKRLGPTSCMA